MRDARPLESRLQEVYNTSKSIRERVSSIFGLFHIERRRVHEVSSDPVERHSFVDCERNAIAVETMQKNTAYYSFLDFVTFRRDFKNADHTTVEVKDEISFHLKMKSALENALPNEIIIGPFRVNVQSLKNLLVQKRQNCSTQLLTMFSESLSARIGAVLTDYLRIIARLRSPSRDIEHLFEEQNWVVTIPLVIKPLDETVQKLTREFDVLDYFWRNLSDQDFEAKWQAIGSSRQVRLLVRVADRSSHRLHKNVNEININKMYFVHSLFTRTIVFSNVFTQIEDATRRFAGEYEKFYKLQMQDEIILSEKSNILVENVANMTLQADIDRVHETAIEMKRIEQMTKEYQKSGLLLNKRQELFGLKVVAYDQLDELMKKFEPYLMLWVTASGNQMREYVSCKNQIFQVLIYRSNIFSQCNITYFTMI